eukprot:CAMPEP_0174954340 /NCGR_PEP_ID=MMETSP0004_2-20121128/369_1 /TAXON_ID=420556 /ORGANISM="Ochromonas sp., Strain CCMP1393" /LENGTH=179 /DNA_ID=CAMNT_0016202141 /DNA_START=131 /DNA_END=670 /DNA_ORIENTATION=+
MAGGSMQFSAQRSITTVASSNFVPFRRKFLVMAVDRKYMQAKDVYIPLDKVQFNFARSSGPGGQNVNKLNTKAEVRFNVPSADWLEPEVKNRLMEYQSNKISKDGDLVVYSQEFRTQGKNKEDCLNKLRYMIAEASVAPKDRKMWEGLSEKGKEKRKEEKRKRGAVKSNRRKNMKDFFD